MGPCADSGCPAGQGFAVSCGRMVGEKLGSYHLVRQIGAGGMGAVFEGRHELLDNRVAIKVLLPELSSDADAVKRFFNEARAATRVKHPGITQIFDFGTASDGSAYFVMELLDGESLAARLRRQPRLTVAEQAAIGRQISGILAAAHQAEIVHRDLKPDNIFLTRDPEMPGGVRVKVLDFGIAKLAESGSAPISVKTRTGSVMGTPYYMSPEQCRGSGEVDLRADIYSLGCVLFEMATSRPPFTGSGLGEVLGAHQFVEPPRPRSLNPGLPSALESLILKTLHKTPEGRPQTMTAVAAALDEIARATPAPGPGAVAAAEVALDSTMPQQPAPQPALPASTTLGAAAGQASAPAPGMSSRRALVAGAAAVVVGAGALVAYLATRKPAHDPAPSQRPQPSQLIATAPSADASTATSPTPAPSSAAAPANRFVRLAGARDRVLMGVASERARENVVGFRPSRAVEAPRADFSIHEHEVTWGELEPWLAQHPEAEVTRPAWVPADATQHARLPATGVSWTAAKAYCRFLGATLPTEAEWEYAARGAGRRPYPWGAEQLDLMRTHVYAGPGAHVEAVMTSDQDRTPGPYVYDLLGNAQEWTSELWREDVPGQDESWVQAGGTTFRTVRGLPVAASLLPGQVIPAEGAAYREPLCATGTCAKETASILELVGFRCVQSEGP